MQKNYTECAPKRKRFASFFLGILSILLCGFSAQANIYTFSNMFSGSQEVPPNNSPGTGIVAGSYDDVTNTLSYSIIFSGLTSGTVAGHHHAPAPPGQNAPVIIPFVGFPTGVMSGAYSRTDVLTEQQEAWLKAGLVYANIHTVTLPGGEIRAQILLSSPLPADVYPFTNILTGTQEVPPNNSPAIGIITGTYNRVNNNLSYTITFSGLTAPATAGHHHAPAPPGVNAPVIIPFVGFPNTTAGTYSATNVLTDQQEMWLFQGLVYANIHNTVFPGGEIRGQIILHSSSTCTAPTMLNDQTIVQDATCGRSDGGIWLVPTSGTGPFQYSINGGQSYVSASGGIFGFQNLAPGTYQLRIKDANGCESAVVTRQIRSVYGGPTFLNDATIVRDASCGMNDGNITIVPTSGTAPFMYSIDNGVTYVSGPATGYTFANLAAGNYWLRLRDANGCESQPVVRYVRPNAYGTCATTASTRMAARPHSSAAQDRESGVRAYPNPSKGVFRVQLSGLAAQRVQVQVLNAQGAVVERRSVNVSEINTLNFDLSSKAKGMYFVRVIGEKGVQVSKVIIQ